MVDDWNISLAQLATTASANLASTFLTAELYRTLGRPSSALPLLEGAIGTPFESGRSYGLLAKVYESSGRPMTRAASGSRGSASSQRTRT